MGIIVSLLARKGGVGKTTLAANLAGLLSAEDLRVRLVDLDSQSSLSQFWLGPEAVEDLRPRDTVEALLEGGKAEDVEVETRLPGVSLVPSHFKLKADYGAELVLDHGPDVTILDTPPNVLDPIVRAGLLASHFVLSPVIPEVFGLQSITTVTNLMATVGVSSNSHLKLLGLVVSLRQRLTVHRALVDLLRRLYGDLVFQTEIPSLVAFKEAITQGKTVFEHEPKGKAAGCMRAFWDEIIGRVKRETERRAA